MRVDADGLGAGQVQFGGERHGTAVIASGDVQLYRGFLGQRRTDALAEETIAAENEYAVHEFWFGGCRRAIRWIEAIPTKDKPDCARCPVRCGDRYCGSRISPALPA